MKRPGPFLILLVCWFAACAGVQLLHPQALLAFPGWWAGQWLTLSAQALAVLLSAWILRERSPLAQWLALLAWWAWPWQGQAQWLRVTPAESAWHLAFTLWLWALFRARSTLAWAATLAMAALQPASLAGAAAGLAFRLTGRQRWVAGLLGGVALLVDYQPPSLEQLGWAALALWLGLTARQPAERGLAFYTLVSAAKGGPTGAVLLALAVARLVEAWRLHPALPLLAGTYLLAGRGETALNRQVIVPWQQSHLSLAAGLAPHSLAWWAERLGPRYGFAAEDAAVCDWLRAQPAPMVAVLEPADDPLLTRLYHELSGRRVLDRPWAWGLAGVESGRLSGSGLNAVVRRGRAVLEQPLFTAGSVHVLGVANPNLPAVEARDFQILARGGPGGELTAQLVADGPVALGEGPPRLVLEPGLQKLTLPWHCDDFRQGPVYLPAQDIAEQLQRVEVTCAADRLPAHSVEVLDLLVSNRSAFSLRLEGLALRARWSGQPWQPPLALGGNLGAGQRLHQGFPLQTADDVSLRWLELVWLEPNGGSWPAARLRFFLWPQQQAERYLNLKP